MSYILCPEKSSIIARILNMSQFTVIEPAIITASLFLIIIKSVFYRQSNNVMFAQSKMWGGEAALQG